MKILVTGGAGFIGANLIKKLLDEGHEIVSIDNYSTGLKTNHQHGANYVDADIREIDDYSKYGNFDITFHLAAIARIQPSFDRPLDYFITNANATFKIANYCSRSNIPLIYAGSSSHHSGKFKNPYTFSKDTGEEIIRLFQNIYRLKASIARFYNVYGPYQLKEGGYCTLIGITEKCVENNVPLTIYGDGNKRRDFTHVEDIVNALCLIKDKKAWGYVFELGRGKNYSIKEIAETFGVEVVYASDRPGETQNTLCADTLAREILEWKPELDVKDYIRNFLRDRK